MGTAGDHHAVAATWQTSVDQLSEAGRHLLERLAFLAPDPVPMFLLDVAVPDAEAEDLRGALTDLTAVSLASDLGPRGRTLFGASASAGRDPTQPQYGSISTADDRGARFDERRL